MKKFIIVAIILGIIAGIAIWIGNRDTNENNIQMTKISVNEVTRSVFYAPQYVAIALGYFEENGLEIELSTGQGADNVMTAVLAGQCDIGFAGPEASIYVYNEDGTYTKQINRIYGRED